MATGFLPHLICAEPIGVGGPATSLRCRLPFGCAATLLPPEAGRLVKPALIKDARETCSVCVLAPLPVLSAVAGHLAQKVSLPNRGRSPSARPDGRPRPLERAPGREPPGDRAQRNREEQSDLLGLSRARARRPSPPSARPATPDPRPDAAARAPSQEASPKSVEPVEGHQQEARSRTASSRCKRYPERPAWSPLPKRNRQSCLKRTSASLGFGLRADVD
jgi:hypothetical protein